LTDKRQVIYQLLKLTIRSDWYNNAHHLYTSRSKRTEFQKKVWLVAACQKRSLNSASQNHIKPTQRIHDKSTSTTASPTKIATQPNSTLNRLLLIKMRFFMITTVAATVAVAIAMPAMDSNSQETPRLCSSATASNPLCCATDVIGVADLDCVSREFLLPDCASTWNQRKSLIHIIFLPAPTLPNDIPDFNKICAATGQRARCCLLSLVRKTYSILVDAILIRDATAWNRCPLLCSHLNVEIPTQGLDGVESWTDLNKR